MTSQIKLLADTNVVIGLEDPLPVHPELARLSRLCAQHHIGIFVHQASVDDIERDFDSARRDITLSKLAKFQRLNPAPRPPDANLSARFGAISTENDRADVALLLALDANAVDFLVTEDVRLQRRARKVGLGERIFGVAQAVEWITNSFESVPVALPKVVPRKAYELDRADPIFDGLRLDYPGFDGWFSKCCREHRDCWVLEADGKRIAGFIIRKDEFADANRPESAGKFLKLCTFKVHDEYRGDRYGELLLKQALWFAQKNGYRLVYLTAFPKQEALIDLLRFYGFEAAAELPSGEQRFEKAVANGPLPECPRGRSIFDDDRFWYPRFHDGPAIRKFCIPIKADYHMELFPEIGDRVQESLFAFEGGSPGQRPGNTIRKVYLCRAQSAQIEPGSLLFFYVSKDSNYVRSQSITTLAVAEKVVSVSSFEDLRRSTARRSVFSDDALKKWDANPTSPVKAIFFLLVGHLEHWIDLIELRKQGILKSAPQSIVGLRDLQYCALKPSLRLGFEI